MQELTERVATSTNLFKSMQTSFFDIYPVLRKQFSQTSSRENPEISTVIKNLFFFSIGRDDKHWKKVKLALSAWATLSQ